jgi:hypothetical protein
MMYLAFSISLLLILIIDIFRLAKDPFSFNCEVIRDPNSTEERDPHCPETNYSDNKVIK